MDGLPTWAICSIVAASAVIGSVSVFLLALVIALLLRSVTWVREPLALVLVAAGEIRGFLRRRRWRWSHRVELREDAPQQ
jgi:hypothetical protein